jgi:uncharacterized protein YbaP (TraB family)
MLNMIPIPTVKGIGIKEYLSESQIKRIRLSLKKYLQIDFDQLSHLRPLFIASYIQQALLKNELAEESLDHQLWSYAGLHNIHCDGLETSQEQYGYLDRMSLAVEYQKLFKTCTNISKSRKELKKLIQIYQQENIYTLYQKTRRGLADNRKLMIHERNELLASRIDEYHQRAPAFFCFGAAHFAGEVGVLRKLKQRGYTIQAIKHLN